jgi:hypothetical protein
MYNAECLWIKTTRQERNSERPQALLLVYYKEHITNSLKLKTP